MKQFESDVTDAFRMIPTLGLANMAEQLFRQHHPDKLNWQFLGIMPNENTPEARATPQDIPWPPEDILPLIEKVNTRTMAEFLDRVAPLVEKHLNRQVFALLTLAFDNLLDRRGFPGTLGQRFNNLKAKMQVPIFADNDMQEIIQRRNDIAHGGVVSPRYINGSSYPGLMNSMWVQKHGLPRAVGVDHTFSLEYLYWATSVMFNLAQLCR